jgi:hypothetical protein
MSLFDKSQAEITKERIITNADNALNVLKISIKIGLKDVWENPNATPEEIIESFGKEGQKLFNFYDEVQKLIKTIEPDYEILEHPQEVSFNKEGKVLLKIREGIENGIESIGK